MDDGVADTVGSATVVVVLEVSVNVADSMCIGEFLIFGIGNGIDRPYPYKDMLLLILVVGATVVADDPC